MYNYFYYFLYIKRKTHHRSCSWYFTNKDTGMEENQVPLSENIPFGFSCCS